MHPAMRYVEVTRLLEIIGQPNQKEPPDGVGHESADDNRPGLPESEQPQPGDFSGAFIMGFITVTLNVSEFVRTETFLALRHLVKWKPECQPDQPGQARHDERHLPTPGQSDPWNNDRGNDRSEV